MRGRLARLPVRREVRFMRPAFACAALPGFRLALRLHPKVRKLCVATAIWLARPDVCRNGR